MWQTAQTASGQAAERRAHGPTGRTAQASCWRMERPSRRMRPLHRERCRRERRGARRMGGRAADDEEPPKARSPTSPTSSHSSRASEAAGASAAPPAMAGESAGGEGWPCARGERERDAHIVQGPARGRDGRLRLFPAVICKPRKSAGRCQCPCFSRHKLVKTMLRNQWKQGSTLRRFNQGRAQPLKETHFTSVWVGLGVVGGVGG